MALVEKNTILRKGSSTQPTDQPSLRFCIEDSTLTSNFWFTHRNQPVWPGRQAQRGVFHLWPGIFDKEDFSIRCWPSHSLNVCAILCKQSFMTASLLLTRYATEYCWIENFPCIDPSVTKPTLTWLIPLRMPLVPILPGPSMAEEAATPRQWWLAHHTALFSQTLSTSVRRPSLLSNVLKRAI